MRVLLTGASGFVGKQLLPMLEKAGYETYCLSRKLNGLNREVVWDFKSPVPNGIPECNIIIHLAACVNFGPDINMEQYDVNTVSTLKLSAYAKTCNAYFILASTIGIHGSSHDRINKDTPIGPENHYAVSKYMAEQVVQTILDDASILRICGIYGLDGPPHLGLNSAINNAFYRKNQPVLKGPGKGKRNYICVLDVARWILSLVVQRAEQRISAGMNREVNMLYLAGSEVMTIREYLWTIVEVLLHGEELVYTEGADGCDSVIDSSPAPFYLTTFRDYLQSLKR